MYDLDTLQDAINRQALTKGWKTDSKFCLKRLKQEVKELEIELNSFDSVLVTRFLGSDTIKTRIALEAIDVIYFLLQIVKDVAPELSLNEIFEQKYDHNWKNKKKTEDKDGNVILK